MKEALQDIGTFIKRKDRYLLLTGFFLSSLFSLVIFRIFFFKPGIVINGDLVWPYSSELFTRYLWHPYFQTPNTASQLIVYSWLFLFLSEFAERLMYFIVFTLAGTSIFYVAFKWVEQRGVRDHHALIAATSSTLIYLLNPVVVMRVSHYFLLWGYAFLPLFFYFAYRAFQDLTKASLKTILVDATFLALLGFVMTGNAHWVVFTFFIILFMFLFNTRPAITYFTKSCLFLLTYFSIYFLLNSYWFFPYLYETFTISIPVPSYVLTRESLDMLSNNANLLNVLSLRGNWWPTELFSNWVLSETTLKAISIFIPIMSFSTLLLYKKDKDVFLLTLFALISLLLNTGTTLVGSFYSWLTFSSPFFSLFGWVFRDPDKWAFFVVFSFSLLTGMFVCRMLSNISLKTVSSFFTKLASCSLMSILLLAVCLPSFPMLTGDIGGFMAPQEIPSSYRTLNAWLETQPGDYKVAFYPSPPLWGIPKPLVRYDSYWTYAITTLFLNRTGHFGSFLSHLNARYFIVRGDVLNEQTTNILSRIQSQKDLIFVHQIDSLYIYENLGCTPLVQITDLNILLYGGLNALNSLTSLAPLTDGNFGVVFANQYIRYEQFAETSDLIVLDGCPFLRLDGSVLLSPFDFTDHHDPSQVWSKATTSDALHAPWHIYLEERNIDSWDFDYGRGLVFTWASSILEQPYSLKDSDLIFTSDFEDTNVGGWTRNAKTAQSLVRSDDSFEGAFSLEVELTASTWGWKVIQAPVIPVSSGGRYAWDFYVAGENAHEVHVKVAEYDADMTFLSSRQVAGIGSGNFSWRRITFEYEPSVDASFVALEIWHGHLTSQPLPNRIWIDNVKVYDLKAYLHPNSLEVPFVIETVGNYSLYMRFFQNEAGGKVALQLGDHAVEVVETKDQINAFMWKKIGTYSLDTGDYVLAVENKHGFNAVNLFAFIPQDASSQTESVGNPFQNKRTMYVLEAESDMYRSSSLISSKYEEDASDGNVLELTSQSRVWRDIEVLNDGSYSLAIHSSGLVMVSLDGTNYAIKSRGLAWNYVDPVPLHAGTHQIEVKTFIDYHTWGFEQPQMDWTISTPAVQTLSRDSRSFEGAFSLKAELTASTWGWKVIQSPAIPVSSGGRYAWDFYVAGENAHEVHVKVAEYDADMTFLSSRQVAGIGSGNFSWRRITFEYEPSVDASFVALEIWHGHLTSQPLPNRIWIDNVVLTEYQQVSDLDVIWLYSSPNTSETIEDLFTPDEKLTDISYQQINPTHYQVEVNTTQPFFLAFAEAYNPLWITYVNDETIQTLPLYSATNGFWINHTGELVLAINFEPQTWLFYGTIISVIALSCSIFLILWDYKTNKRFMILS